MVNANFWKNKRVFITGHTGFKGSWLSYWLKLMGADVSGYALEPPTKPSLFNILSIEKKIKSYIGDINNLDLLKEAIDEVQPEVVFHLAAQPLVRESYNNPIHTYMTNVMGTVNIMQCIRQCRGVKAVVNITTDKVYENKEWLWGYRENDILGGYDPYSNSKTCSELVTKSFRDSFFNSSNYDKHKVAIATARAGNVIGGGDWAADRLIPDCIKAVERSNKIILRNPNSIRPWQHVLEPLSGYLILAEKLDIFGAKFGQEWNFGPKDDNCVKVLEVVKKFCCIWGNNAEYEILEMNDGLHESAFLKLDCSKANKILNWEPIWNIDTAIERTIDIYKSFYNNENVEKIIIEQIYKYMADSL